MDGEMTSDSEWENLPLLVVFLILDKLLEPIDHVRFAVVCKQWLALAKDYNHSTQRWHQSKIPPMLLIPTKNRGGGVLYSLSEGKVYSINTQSIQFPPRKIDSARHCCGSGYGWLAIIDKIFLERHWIIHLLNPFRTAVPCRIRLPDLRCHLAESTKVLLSADPASDPNNYLVIALFVSSTANWGLAFNKAGQDYWTRITMKLEYGLTDAIFFKGRVYAVSPHYGGIMSFDLVEKTITIHPNRTGRMYPQEGVLCCPQAYLVESTEGDLLHVRRLMKRKGQTTESFEVYKLVFHESTVEQVEVKSIEDEVLFLGDQNQSKSFLASKFPGVEANSIYYTDDAIGSEGDRVNCDMGIFNLEDGTITKHYPQLSRYMNVPPAFWIMPVFNGLANC